MGWYDAEVEMRSFLSYELLSAVWGALLLWRCVVWLRGALGFHSDQLKLPRDQPLPYLMH